LTRHILTGVCVGNISSSFLELTEQLVI